MHGHYGKRNGHLTNQMSDRGIAVWIRSFNEPDSFDQNVPFDNTILIYFINLLWKFELRLELDLKLQYFCIFAETNENERLIFRALYVK